MRLEDYVVEGSLPALPDKGRESTSTDYWNTMNPVGLVYNNPHLRYSSANDDGYLDTDDERFKSIYETADSDTKEELLGARSVEHALMIAERRNVQAESMQAISNDGIATQIFMGAIPAMASPTSLIPVAGVGGKILQIGKTVSRMTKIGKVAAIGAASGAVANLGDELIIGAQGMEAHPLSATLVGAGFGGTLGIIGGALSGPYGKTHAEAMSSKGDTFTKDFDTDPHIKTEVDENGIVKIVEINPEAPITDVARQKKFFTDYIPLIGKFLRSDVNTVYQSNSSALRLEMTKIANSTVSIKDSSGNVVPVHWNAMNDLKQADGMYMKHNKKVEEV